MEITRQSFLVAATSAILIPQVEVADARNSPIYGLPKSSSRRFAWTIDDGASAGAVGTYLNIAEHHNQNLTLFVTSSYSSWRTHSKQISRLLHSGKIQLGNHTVSHKDLSRISGAEIRTQISGCHKFLMNEFGYDARPYFRPTYGNWNAKVLRVAAELGYTVPTMWYGSFGDSGDTPESRFVQLANKWIANGRIVIDHANRVKSEHALHEILGTINSRLLHSVTLREAFGTNFK